MADLSQKLKDLPEKSGVYIMRSAAGQILYVGKAKVLKNRVRQYFQNSVKTAHIMTMVSKIADFDYIITRNEVEALVLENNLIKKHKPPYNILLKDDKSYPFIKLNLKSDFPRVEIVRRLQDDGSKYFGPYMQGVSSKDILELIYSAFPLRSCKLDFSKPIKNHRPCLNYHIGKCLAPCVGLVDKETYKSVADDVVKFLKGNDKSVGDILTKKMNDASEAEEYELALDYKHKLEILDKLVRKQIAALPKHLNMDIFAIAGNGLHTVVAVLFVRAGKVLGGEKHQVRDMALNLSQSLSNFLTSYYSSSAFNTDEIVLASEIESLEAVEEFIKEQTHSKVNIILPRQGVRRQLADMAQGNASDFLEKCVNGEQRKEDATFGAIVQLQEYLNLQKLPSRMECYDISNISGTDNVSSMVVFTNGEADKQQYRRFKIKTVEGANDFASMKETLSRRLNRAKEGDESFATLPDLIIIDGGKGQLAFAKEALEQSGFDIEIISLAKREEEVFLPDRNESVILPKDSYALKLLQRIRDEAHRFAITYHRKLRSKRQTDSRLKTIDGIGEKKIEALYSALNNINAISTAGEKELSAIKGISQKDAQRIRAYFDKYK